MAELKRAQNAPWFLDPSQFKQPLQLDIGAGGYSSDSRFTSVDLFTDCDIQASMWEIPLPDNSVHAIFCSNALEHIGKKEIVPTLREWHRLLIPQGRLQLVIPDLEWACLWWLEHQNTDWSMDILFGHQGHDGEYHKTGFTPRIIWDYFQEARGWNVHKIEYILGDYKETPLPDGKIKTDVSQRCISVEAEKSNLGVA